MDCPLYGKNSWVETYLRISHGQAQIRLGFFHTCSPSESNMLSPVIMNNESHQVWSLAQHSWPRRTPPDPSPSLWVYVPPCFLFHHPQTFPCSHLSHILQLPLDLGRLVSLISALPTSSRCPALNRNSPSCDKYFSSWSMIAPLRKARKQMMRRNEKWGEPALCIEKSLSTSLLLECRRLRTMRGMATVILCFCHLLILIHALSVHFTSKNRRPRGGWEICSRPHS